MGCVKQSGGVSFVQLAPHFSHYLHICETSTSFSTFEPRALFHVICRMCLMGGDKKTKFYTHTGNGIELKKMILNIAECSDRRKWYLPLLNGIHIGHTHTHPAIAKPWCKLSMVVLSEIANMKNGTATLFPNIHRIYSNILNIIYRVIFHYFPFSILRITGGDAK